MSWLHTIVLSTLLSLISLLSFVGSLNNINEIIHKHGVRVNFLFSTKDIHSLGFQQYFLQIVQ
jgi:hypothetical protein